MNDASIIQLGNGLRLLHIYNPGVTVDYFGVAVNAGSRDDPDGKHGLAHFVEHTLFKGTQRRRSWHIINRMESCGGELNAYTTKESTTVYSVFPSGNLLRAADLIADLVMNSSFPADELDKEREVVADEINSYLDIPSEAVFDDFEDLLFKGSPLGHNILGDVRSLEKFDTDMCRDYLRRLYVASNLLVFYSGSEPADKVSRTVTKHFSAMRCGDAVMSRTRPLPAERFEVTRAISNHQAHTVIGTSVCDMFDDRRFAFSVLVNLLGGPGMNSMLNVALREKRGLVYSVDASATLLSDAGMFGIYFGCDPADTARCRRIALDIIGRLASSPLTERKLSMVIRQYIGQMKVAADNRENTVLSLARQVLYRGRIIPRELTVERIRSLRPVDIMDAAAMIAPDRLSSLTLC